MLIRSKDMGRVEVYHQQRNNKSYAMTVISALHEHSSKCCFPNLHVSTQAEYHWANKKKLSDNQKVHYMVYRGLIKVCVLPCATLSLVLLFVLLTWPPSYRRLWEYWCWSKQTHIRRPRRALPPDNLRCQVVSYNTHKCTHTHQTRKRFICGWTVQSCRTIDREMFPEWTTARGKARCPGSPFLISN